ncbi:MAG: hypothetical protein ACKVXR_12980 [Planctomycetota bacterium]
MKPRFLLLVLPMLPALVVGPAFEGGTAWLHTHGTSGGHLHLVAAATDHSHPTSPDEEHDAWHGHCHDSAPPIEGIRDEPAPEGLRIQFPDLLVIAPGGSVPRSATSSGMLAVLPPPLRHWTVLEHPRPADPRPSAGPPRRARRSGLAELVRSSHAILI